MSRSFPLLLPLPHATARTDASSGSVSELNASDGSTVRTVSVGSGPNGVAFDRSHMWVTNVSSSSMSKL